MDASKRLKVMREAAAEFRKDLQMRRKKKLEVSTIICDVIATCGIM